MHTSGARPSVASSRMSMRGLVIRARPMASICRSPPESWLPKCPRRSASCGNSANILSSVQGSARPKRLAAVATRFSRTVRLGNTCLPSGTRPSPACATRYEGNPCSGLPSNAIVPPRMGTMPMIERTVVVFPMPFRPSKVATSPARTPNETPKRTWLCPYAVASASTSSIKPRSPRPGRRAALPRWHGPPPAYRWRKRGGRPEPYAVGKRKHCVHIVLDQDEGLASLEGGEESDHALRLLCAHAGDRLIEQHQPRARRERHRDLERSLLAVREAPRRQPGARAQAHLLEHPPRGLLQRTLGARSAPEAKARAGVRLHREHHVLERGEIDVDAGDLERARETPVRARRRRERGDVLARETHAAPVRNEVARKLADQRRLARAVRPDDRVRLAFQHFEVDVVAREQCAEALGEAADFEQDLIHSCRRAVPRGRA